jgi:hypothetical protein
MYTTNPDCAKAYGSNIQNQVSTHIFARQA